MNKKLLNIREFSFTFVNKDHRSQILKDVNLELDKGEMIGLVGESGSGKSTLARSIIRMHDFKHKVEYSGKIEFDGNDLIQMNEHQLNEIRGSQISIVFQDPLSYLNPIYKIKKQIGEVLFRNKQLTKKEIEKRIIATLADVRFDDPESYMESYPFQLSGGERQRMIIATAMISKPSILIADEVTSSLDAITEREILEILYELCHSNQISILMISHNLHTIKKFVDKIVIIYSGRIVETIDNNTNNKSNLKPRHPYTKALFACANAKKKDGKFLFIEGTPPSPDDNVSGCPFHQRCEFATDICWETFPERIEYENGCCCCHNPLSKK